MRFLLRLWAGLGLVAMLALAVLAIRTDAPAARAAPTTPPPTPEIEQLPNIGSSAGSALLARDPFSQQRGQFSRAPPAEQNAAPRDVRLVGVSTVAGHLRATLMIDGQQIHVSLGDSTPVGEVTALSAAAIEFSGSGPARLELFP